MDKKLKMWVRYDVRGKIVTGSNRLNRTKPLNGTWKEVITEVCCTTITTTNIITSTTTTTESLIPFGAIMNKAGTEYIFTKEGDYITVK